MTTPSPSDTWAFITCVPAIELLITKNWTLAYNVVSRLYYWRTPDGFSGSEYMTPSIMVIPPGVVSAFKGTEFESLFKMQAAYCASASGQLQC